MYSIDFSANEYIPFPDIRSSWIKQDKYKNSIQSGLILIFNLIHTCYVHMSINCWCHAFEMLTKVFFLLRWKLILLGWCSSSRHVLWRQMLLVCQFQLPRSLAGARFSLARAVVVLGMLALIRESELIKWKKFVTI